MLNVNKNHKGLSFIILIFTLIGVMIILSACGLFTSEEKISTSVSPDNAYTLEAYKINGGATVDFSVKVYKTDNKTEEKTLIYNKYHEYKADIQWISNDIVSINEVSLDLSKNETYDWRDE